MLKELTQFVKEVPDLVRERAIEPKVGLHILIRFNEEGNGIVVNHERYEKQSTDRSSFIQDSLEKLRYAWMINDDTNKCLSKSKDIHSVSPFCLGFKRESWKGGDFFQMNKQNKLKPSFNDRIEDYFSRCTESPYNDEEKIKQVGIQFKNFLKQELEHILQQIDISELSQSEYIILYNDVEPNMYKQFYAMYLAEKLFNTSNFNIETNGKTLGTSNFYNGFNSKKPFLTHLTASFDITGRISADAAEALAEFQAFGKKKLFPNPLPIFIDQPELTNEAIKLYHRSEEQKLTHRDIITELWRRKKDLGNYYLLFFNGGAIQDFDFVSKFKYYLSDEKDVDGNPKNWVIENITEREDKERTLVRPIYMNDVFRFEREVIGQLFDYKLVNYDEKKGTKFMYFDDIESKWYRPVMYSLLLRYRKPVYDFIYKSMRSGINVRQFEDICMLGILDNLKENKEYAIHAIKAKLNIFFSLYQYFNKTHNSLIMPSKIANHKAEITQVVDDTEVHFSSDETYAFGAGQLIYYLLSKSEAGERTHAVLEPFLQKTNHVHFNDALASILLKYKHAIGFDFKRFNKLASEVLDYSPGKGLQELRPFLLAGYFCPNIFYTKKSNPEQ